MPSPVSPPKNSRPQATSGLAERSDGCIYETIDKYNGHARAARAASLSPKPPLHSEKARSAARGTRLLLVARRRPILRTFAPIAGTSSQPFESRMIGNSLQHQAQAIAIVRRKTEFGPVRHDFREPVEGLAGQDAAFLVAPLRPRVGEQDEDAIDGRRRQRRDQQPRIIGKHLDVVEMTALDLR